jgi:hypothetical protein
MLANDMDGHVIGGIVDDLERCAFAWSAFAGFDLRDGGGDGFLELAFAAMRFAQQLP